MEIIDFKLENAPLQKLENDFLFKAGVNLYVKREDMIHPALSGNKWYKLKYNLMEAKQKGLDTLLTFGGAYSNHIYATASAGKIFGFKTIGVIRGEEHLPLNPTLQFAVDCGMYLYYLNRNDYRKKNSEGIIALLKNKFGSFYLIPEGGSNTLAVKGCADILDSIEIDYDYVCAPCGTGGTIAGIISSLKENKKILGFAVLKGASFLKTNVHNFVHQFTGEEFTNWEINLEYHFGGYAKYTNELLKFIKNFETVNNIPLEPIYSGKMVFGIYDLIEKELIKRNTTLILIHTGGLQGLKGMQEKINKIRP